MSHDDDRQKDRERAAGAHAGSLMTIRARWAGRKKLVRCANTTPRAHPTLGRIALLFPDVQKAVSMKRGILQLLLLTILSGAATSLSAGDLRITLPKQSRLSPVQVLNRDGVKAVKRGRVDKAKQLFVRAYLLDPDDPFTLNNLGYISELEGDADHALKYYDLAAHASTEALIDEASKPGLKGQPVNEAFPASQAPAFMSNKANVRAIVLLEKGRVFEAESILKAAVQADPRTHSSSTAWDMRWSRRAIWNRRCAITWQPRAFTPTNASR